jgi:cytochrome o ubiquinol oxidase subunit II
MHWSRFLGIRVNQLFRNIGKAMRVAVVVFLPFLLSGCNTGVINPVGLVARVERLLLFDSLLLMLLIVVPVIVMSFLFAFRYRSGRNAKYTPDWSHNNTLEAICWGFPCVIVVVLAVWAWTSTHKLDPYKPLDIPGKPLEIQAVSLRWKWLFIYPEQNIATVNYVELPEGRQVAFKITSDAPMNGLFIPQLASQIYSMGGMRTQLHVVANKLGVFDGFSSNYSGDGFSEMNFKAHVVGQSQFDDWVGQMQKKNHELTIDEYARLAAPSSKAPVAFYSSVYPGLFDKIMMQFMMPNKEFYDRQSAQVVAGV